MTQVIIDQNDHLEKRMTIAAVVVTPGNVCESHMCKSQCQ